MPNTAVKPANAESTWGEAPWEDRKPLIQRKRHTENLQCVFFCALLYSGYLAILSILCYSEIIIKRKEVKIMYPVQLMISYFTTSFTAIMHIGREVTAKQYTGGGIYKIIKIHIYQAQEWVRLVSYRYKEGQCRHILSFLACLHSFVISNYWLPPVCHSVWNDRSMTMFV